MSSGLKAVPWSTVSTHRVLGAELTAVTKRPDKGSLKEKGFIMTLGFKVGLIIAIRTWHNWFTTPIAWKQSDDVLIHLALWFSYFCF